MSGSATKKRGGRERERDGANPYWTNPFFLLSLFSLFLAMCGKGDIIHFGRRGGKRRFVYILAWKGEQEREGRNGIMLFFLPLSLWFACPLFLSFPSPRHSVLSNNFLPLYSCGQGRRKRKELMCKRASVPICLKWGSSVLFQHSGDDDGRFSVATYFLGGRERGRGRRKGRPFSVLPKRPWLLLPLSLLFIISPFEEESRRRKAGLLLLLLLCGMGGTKSSPERRRREGGYLQLASSLSLSQSLSYPRSVCSGEWKREGGEGY